MKILFSNAFYINTFPAAPKNAISPPLRELAANLLKNDLFKLKKALQEQLFISYTLNISQKSHDIYIYICHPRPGNATSQDADDIYIYIYIYVMGLICAYGRALNENGV